MPYIQLRESVNYFHNFYTKTQVAKFATRLFQLICDNWLLKHIILEFKKTKNHLFIVQ